MICRWVAGRLGQYVDLGLGIVEAAVVRWHLARCESCHQQYERFETVGEMLSRLPRPAPPPRMALRIQCALSAEALAREHPGARWGRRRLILDNLLRPIAVPVVGGLSLALLLVPALLSVVWMGPVAHADDVPLRLLARPVISAPMMALPSPYPVARDFTVFACIDAHGDVFDYAVATNELVDSGFRRELANMLLTSKFQPAMRFGMPISGCRVIVFQRIESHA